MHIACKETLSIGDSKIQEPKRLGSADQARTRFFWRETLGARENETRTARLRALGGKNWHKRRNTWVRKATVRRLFLTCAF